MEEKSDQPEKEVREDNKRSKQDDRSDRPNKRVRDDDRRDRRDYDNRDRTRGGSAGARGRARGGREFVRGRGGQQSRGGGYGGRGGRGRGRHDYHSYERTQGFGKPRDNKGQYDGYESEHSENEDFPPPTKDTRRRVRGEESDVSAEDQSPAITDSSSEKGEFKDKDNPSMGEGPRDKDRRDNRRRDNRNGMRGPDKRSMHKRDDRRPADDAMGGDDVDRDHQDGGHPRHMGPPRDQPRRGRGRNDSLRVWPWYH